MKYLDFSTPALVCFGVEFVLASLVALALYGMARIGKRWAKVLNTLAGIAAGLAATLLILATLGSKSWPYPLFFLALTMALSAVQAFLERGAGRESWSWGQQWGRSFVTYLFSGLIGTFIAAYSEQLVIILFFGRFRWYPFAMMAPLGYLLGGALAPLAISFFRWAVPSLQLRPGVDRQLQDEEKRAEQEQEMASQSEPQR